MRNVASSSSNPFGLDPECPDYVAGYGDPNANFHVVGDHPGVHGGAESGFPFTGTESGRRLQRALAAAGIIEAAGSPPEHGDAFFSYLHMCVTDGEPGDGDYARLEPLFDSELRAITAHVLIPVGERATRHVFANYTARPADEVDVDRLHGTEIRGSGWLVYPVKEPANWSDQDERRLVAALRELLRTDYRREADLGRFLHGGDPYLVR